MDRPMYAPGGAAPPDNNLVLAVLSLFCCWPFAIPALINATQVQSKWAMGDQAGATYAAAQAKKWAMIAIIVGISLWVLFAICYIGIIVLGIGMAASVPSTYSP